MTILVFLIVLLAQLITSAQTIWRNSEARTDAFRDARAALELMSKDLSLALTNDRAPVLALSNVYTQTDDLTVGPQNNQQVYALIPVRNNGDPPPVTPTPTPTQAIVRSDICAVGFYCSWDAIRHAYVLRKHFVESNPTYSNLQAAFGPATPTPPPLPSPAPTGPPIAPASIYQPFGPTTVPSPTPPQPEDEDVAAYVWDLKIIPYENNGGALIAHNYPVEYRAILPQYLEISFKAFSPQAARQLQAENINPSDWFNTNSSIYKNQILPHSQVFTTRIRLQNARVP